MKKLISVLLSLCMLLSCAAFAEGFQAHVTVSEMGKTQYDITASLQTDEDGCIQVSIDGLAEDDPISAFIQVGAEALVLGSEGEYAQIDYDTFVAALQNVLPETLTDDQLMVIGLIYYAVTGLQDEQGNHNAHIRFQRYPAQQEDHRGSQDRRRQDCVKGGIRSGSDEGY